MRRVTGAVLALAGLVAAGCAGDGRRGGGVTNDAAVARGAAGGSVADAGFLRQYAETNRFRNGTPRGFQITPDGGTVLFLRSGARDFAQDLYAFDVETGEERVVLTADQILGGGDEEISAEEQARRERMRESARGITSFELSEDGDWLLVPLDGRLFVMDLLTGNSKELPSLYEHGEDGRGGYPIDARFSPDGNWVSCVRGGDVFVMKEGEWREFPLTYSWREPTGISYGSAEFVAQEEMDRREGYWWSPDSDQLLIQQTDERAVESVYIMDPSDPGKPPQSWKYPRPGKTNAEVSLRIAGDVSGESEIGRVVVKWDRERYPYLARVVWSEHSTHRGGPTILVQNREQTEQVLLAVDPLTGVTHELLTERDEAWVNIDEQMPRFLPDGSFLWTTERNGGGRELERRNYDGSFRNTVVSKEEGYRSLCDVDYERGEVIVVASPEPTEARLMRVSLDGGAVTELFAQETGLQGAEFGEGGQHGVFVHESSSLDGRTTWTVRTRDGEVKGEIRSVAERPSFEATTEFVEVTGDRLRCAVTRPRNFDASRAGGYPVILHAYTGPGVQMVKASRERYALAQWIADHGYIVVSIDGRGTPNRGRDWERVIKGNLVDIALEDQVRGLRALGARFPEMDMDRVGVFGWSYGGYFSAIATMKRPDVFKCGVAGAPVCDWMDYDTHYTERYLGVPSDADDEAYRVSNVLTYAEALERPLLIIHGTADDNVYFVHALKMSDALTRAGKDHEFMVLGGFTHMVTEPAMVEAMYGRMMGFLGEELGE